MAAGFAVDRCRLQCWDESVLNSALVVVGCGRGKLDPGWRTSRDELDRSSVVEKKPDSLRSDYGSGVVSEHSL
jgi:hypothetical protein